MWKISKGFERPRESRRTLKKEALNRTESFRRSPSSGSVSEQSDDESYMRISFSFGQRSFPVIDSLPDTMMYRKGSLPYPSEYHPCHIQRRMLSPGMSPSSICMATDCFPQKHSLQNVGILDPLCKPSSKETVNNVIRRTSEPLFILGMLPYSLDIWIYRYPSVMKSCTNTGVTGNSWTVAYLSLILIFLLIIQVIQIPYKTRGCLVKNCHMFLRRNTVHKWILNGSVRGRVSSSR